MLRAGSSDKEEQTKFISDIELNYPQERKWYLKWIKILAVPTTIALIVQVLASTLLWKHYPSALSISLCFEGLIFLLGTFLALIWTNNLEKTLIIDSHALGQSQMPTKLTKILFFLTAFFVVAALMFMVIVNVYRDWYEGYFQAAVSNPATWVKKYGNYTVDQVTNLYRNIIQILGGLHLAYLFFFHLVSRTAFKFLEFKNKSLSQLVFLATTFLLAAGLSMVYFAENLKFLNQANPHGTGFSNWTLDALSSTGIGVAVLAFLVFFFNWKKWRIGLLVSGLALLITFALLARYTAGAYRHAQSVHSYYESEANCAAKLGDTHMAELTKFGCPSKYVIVDGSVSTSCSNSWLGELWEKDIGIPAEQKAHQQGCLNEACCGVLANLYTVQLYIFSHVILLTTILAAMVTIGSYYLWYINWLDYGLVRSNRDLVWLGVKMGIVIAFVILLFGTRLEAPSRYSQIAVNKDLNKTITPVNPEEIGGQALYLFSLNSNAMRLRKDPVLQRDAEDLNGKMTSARSNRRLISINDDDNKTITPVAGDSRHMLNTSEVLRGTVGTESAPGKLEGIDSAQIVIFGIDGAELASLKTGSNGDFSVALPKNSENKPEIIKATVTAKGYLPATYSSQIGGFPERNTTEMGCLELIKLPARVLPELVPKAPVLTNASDNMSNTSATSSNDNVKNTAFSATVTVTVESAFDGSRLNNSYAYLYLEPKSLILQNEWVYPLDSPGDKLVFDHVQSGNLVLVVKSDGYISYTRNLVIRNEDTNITVALTPKNNGDHALQLLLNLPDKQDFTLHANFDVDDTNICFITTLFSNCGGISKFAEERQYESLHVSTFGKHYYLFYVRQLKQATLQPKWPDDEAFANITASSNSPTATDKMEKSIDNSSRNKVDVTASVSEKPYANSANSIHTTITSPGIGRTHQLDSEFASSTPRPLSKSAVFLDIYLPGIDKLAARLYAPSQVPKNIPEDQTLTWLAFCMDGRVGPRSIKALNRYWDPYSSTGVLPNAVAICSPLYSQEDHTDSSNQTKTMN